MKLKAMKTYQTVDFNKKNHHYFTDSRDLGLQGVQLEYLPEVQAVRVRLEGRDDIMVFTTNIAYVIPADTKVANVTENRAKLKNIDDTKAPKQS